MKSKQHLFTIYIAWVTNIGQSMHYIQAWKIFTTKSAENISITSYIICLILLIHWLIYGILLRNKIIIIAETLGIIGAMLVIYGTLLYS